MAKSARSSVRKRNNATLRAKIFGPAVDARTERLSAKLQELINKPKPEEEKAMDVDEQKEDDSTKDATSTGIEDIEMQAVITHKPSRNSEQKKSVRSSQRKVAKRKAKHQVVFPSEIARRRRQTQGKKS